MINERKNINTLKPYTCARDIFKKGIFLDANESPSQWIEIDWEKINNLNRYPDSTADKLRKKLSESYLENTLPEEIFIGAGSDEIIDLLIRGFVENDDFIMVMNPSYSIYTVQAEINDIGVKSIDLNPDFSLNTEAIISNLEKVSIIFLCSPNNPTGNLICIDEVEKIARNFMGLIVIDEAYIEYAGIENSLIDLTAKYENIVILRTFSKAWGLAGIRLGYSISNKSITNTLLKIKDSYNVSKVSQEIALQALDQTKTLKEAISNQLKNKKLLVNALEKRKVECIATTTNFVLAKISNPTKVYKTLCKNGVVVRDRSNQSLLDNVIRISVGTNQENEKLLKILDQCL